MSDNNQQDNEQLVSRNHMKIPWSQVMKRSQKEPVLEANLVEKAAIIGRVGMIMLSCGTGAWRVRDSMNTVARVLQVACSADIGLVSISYSCFDVADKYSSVTESLSQVTSGVNTTKLAAMENFVDKFSKTGKTLTVGKIHHLLDKIQSQPKNYQPEVLGLAAAIACSCFVFLLGGGPIEMFCSFLGAGLGNFVRASMDKRKLTLFIGLAAGVATACLTYLAASKLLEFGLNTNSAHEAGYIGSMLFAIPGFPFITSGLDIAKLDMRSGIERLIHAITIVLVATLVGWIIALASDLRPATFAPLGLSPLTLGLLRFPASFFGVYGFSIMFNSTTKMASLAASIGAIANTLRLELVDLTTLPPAAAAFLGALVAGLLASSIHKKFHYPRISLTVPAIVIMVPGLYMYRAMYYLGIGLAAKGAQWLLSAIMILLFLPLGLILARVLMDPDWRHAN